MCPSAAVRLINSTAAWRRTFRDPNTYSLTVLQEWEYAKVRQDAQLERIERGVGTLGDMAKGMQVRPGTVRTLKP